MDTSLAFAVSRLVQLMQSNHLQLREALTAFRKEWVTRALRDTNGNNCRAAHSLGLHRNTLSRVTHELGIDVRAIRQAR